MAKLSSSNHSTWKYKIPCIWRAMIYLSKKKVGLNLLEAMLMLTLLASLSKEFKPLITALDAVGDENVSKKKVKNMFLNDADRTSDSKTVEDVFLQNEIGIEEEKKINGTMARKIK